jgi:hypothetical protein
MATPVKDIIKQFDDLQKADENLKALNSPSQSAIYRLWKYITALVINLHEQLWDIKKIELEDVAKYAPPGSDYWIYTKVKEFQYSAINPQEVALNTTTMEVGYPIIDESLKIISRAAVKTSYSKKVNIKVAKGEPPVPLSAPELTALTTYLMGGGNGTVTGKGILFAGVSANVTSINPDRVYIKGKIIYNGQYASVIQTKVIEAINNYFKNITPTGDVKTINIIDAIQSVVGVVDIKLESIAIRAASTPFTSKTYMMLAFQTILTSYPTFAGYVIEEDEPSEDYTNTLTFEPV